MSNLSHNQSSRSLSVSFDSAKANLGKVMKNNIKPFKVPDQKKSLKFFTSLEPKKPQKMISINIKKEDSYYNNLINLKE